MRKSLYDSLNHIVSTAAAVITASADGATIDLKGFSGCMFVANVGISGDTLSGSLYTELHLEHSDDGSSWAAVPDADMQDAVSGGQTGTYALIDDAAEDPAVFKASYKGPKRYVRSQITLTGTHTNGTPIGIQAIRHHAELEPVA